MRSYKVLSLLTLCTFLLLSVHSTLMQGALNEVFTVNVTRDNDMKIIYHYNLTLDHNMYMRAYVEAYMDYGQSALFIFNNDDDRVNHIKLTNSDNQTIISGEKTICQTLNFPKYISQQRYLKVEVSTKSLKMVKAKIVIKILEDFVIYVNISRIIRIDNMSPIYFLFKFDNNTEQVNVRVNTTDKMCMILSIQDAECPVYESIVNVKSKGIYQSVSNSGSIVVQKRNMKNNRFFVVFVLFNNIKWCKENFSNVSKSQFTLTIENIPSTNHYILPVFGVIGFYMGFYLIAAVISFTYNPWIREENATDFPDNTKIWSSLKSSDRIFSVPHKKRQKTEDVHDYWYDNRDFRKKPKGTKKMSIDSKDFNRQQLKTFPSLSDYFKKPTKVLNENYLLYLWYLIIIAVFYALPVIQLVITYQSFLRSTGNQDICYYNFKCTRPFHIFTAFNNIFSNIGYVLLGFLFILITWKRDLLYKQYKAHLKIMNQNVGIPQYYGLFYAMGFSLVMEGVMSACYHICPTKSNIQFDTAFMYIMVCLCMLKVYQTRHPDFNASAQSFFMTMSFIIFVGVIGVNYNILPFWIVFTISYLIINVLVTVELYYVGKCNIDFSLLLRMYHIVRREKWKAFKPIYKIRMITLLIINVTNLILAILGAVLRPRSFTAFLLAILMLNLLLYLAVYVAMKIKYCEHFNILHIAYISFATICWGLAINCFMKFPTQWLKTPAESREQNLRCMLFDFYDIHDVWHFLSAMSLFVSFLALQTLDDNLLKVDRDKIPEF